MTKTRWRDAEYGEILTKVDGPIPQLNLEDGCVALLNYINACSELTHSDFVGDTDDLMLWIDEWDGVIGVESLADGSVKVHYTDGSEHFIPDDRLSERSER